jgi:hypothetical protein
MRRNASPTGRVRSPIGRAVRALSEAYRSRLFVPTHLSACLRDALGLTSRDSTPAQSMQCAIDWLVRAQEVGGGGVSAYYSFGTGWSPAYPETTGYIISTMFDYFHQTGIESYKDCAIRMADWEVKIQMPEGAFSGGQIGLSPTPVVFNTGQVLEGLVRAYEETRQECYRAAARRAGDWLVAIQEPDGSWVRHTYRSTVHTYHTRVAWPLYSLYQITADGRYAAAAERNLEWALRNQLPNGWFRHNVIYLHSENALTHSIAYAIQGFLEAGVLMSNERYIAAARLASDAMLGIVRATGWLQASYDATWKSNDRYSCLTGNAQMAIVWLRLFEITGDEQYAVVARTINSRLRALQNVTSRHFGIRGGIKGSDPIYGAYMPFCYLNWATKFFVDALLLEDRLFTSVRVPVSAGTA